VMKSRRFIRYEPLHNVTQRISQRFAASQDFDAA
jgi:hypothetical protein